MSLIPEILIQQALVQGIRDLRNNPWKSDQLFKSVPQSYAQQFNQLLTDTPVDITLNYPREDSQFPCIAILLRAEDESVIVLGDLLGAGADYDNGLVGSREFFFESGVDSTDTDYSGILGGEPRRLFDKSVPVYKEHKGSGFSSSYMLQIMTDDQDFTILLYHAIRSIIVSNIAKFEVSGMYQMKLSGTDFLPQPGQQPTFIFMRGLSLSFMYFVDHFLVYDGKDPNLETLASAFVLDIERSDAKEEGILALGQTPHVESVTEIVEIPGTTGGGGP
jgi:hypothetical protein